MAKLIFINGNNRIVFGVNEEYWVNINRDVDGINDIKNNVFINNNGNNSTFLGLDTECKNIVVEGYIRTAKSRVHDSMRKLNRALYSENVCSLVYSNGDIKRQISCIAEIAPQYSSNPVIPKFKIIFKCLEPYWSEESSKLTKLSSWKGGLEFPLEFNNVVFEEREQSLIGNVINNGDINSSVFITIIANGDVINPEITNVKTGEFIKLNISLQIGDTVNINTENGSKSIILWRNKTYSNIFKHLQIGSSFFVLRTGDNLFNYNATAGINNMDIYIYHKNKYLSV